MLGPAHWFPSRRDRNRLAHALHGNGPGPTAKEVRARVAGRAALPAELQAVGFSVQLVPPLELLRVHRRRLTGAAGGYLLAVVGSSHIVGDDFLCSNEGRGGPLAADLWKMADKFRWGDATHPRPMVLSPDHLTRLQDRVHWELTKNPAVQAVVVVVTVPRSVLDAASDWGTFSASADLALLQGWGCGVGVSSVVGFANPPPCSCTRLAGR